PPGKRPERRGGAGGRAARAHGERRPPPGGPREAPRPHARRRCDVARDRARSLRSGVERGRRTAPPPRRGGGAARERQPWTTLTPAEFPNPVGDAASVTNACTVIANPNGASAGIFTGTVIAP